MSKYYKRVITYNNNTENYTVEIPELGISAQSDTEVQALRFAREAIEEYCKQQSRVIKAMDGQLDMYDGPQD